MAGYTKLFNSILLSTIWREDDKTRIVWITLLAMADKNGIAETSLPSLADAARVSFDDCVAAIEKLKSPDKHSRTKQHEGRRIEECDGGFLLLNHGKYRAKMGADERREYNRVKQQEWRKENVKPVSTKVNDKKVCQHSQDNTEAASASASEAKASGLNLFSVIEARLLRLFGRTSGESLTYSEQPSVSEISRRPNAMAEIDAIEKFHKNEPKYFPQSLQSLVNNWQPTLDRARNWKPNLTPEEEKRQKNLIRRASQI
jgi:hypothetical protein